MQKLLERVLWNECWVRHFLLLEGVHLCHR